jgi:hypothetical protein
MVQDIVNLTDGLKIKVGDKTYEYTENEIYPIKGYLKMITRERGKIVETREHSNVFTTTGKEWISQLMSYSSYSPLTGARNDRIKYIGIGTGSQPQVPSVSALITPISFDGTNFLAQLNIATYPLTVSKVQVQYSKMFDLTELSVSSSVYVSEAGLFTDGNPNSNFAPGTRDISLLNAAQQSPAFYWTTDPLLKSQDFTLEILWTITVS